MRVKKTRILITGANGQIGTVLTHRLREKYGDDNVIASDLRRSDLNNPFEIIDVTDSQLLEAIIIKYEITQIYHLAALLSSKGEDNINLTWKINLDAYLGLLDVSRKHNIEKVFFPSTIGVFGATTPRHNTPQNTSLLPSTVYGISKITGELWSQYYKNRYNLDIRSLRYPGVISYESIPSGGTTDFAVEMFFEAVRNKHYNCYLTKDTRLPMIYMPDVIDATIQLMESPADQISIASGYNLASFSLSPVELYNEIQKIIPEFTIEYNPDHRQKIADSWTESIDDSQARTDWNWSPEFDMKKMVSDMMSHIK